MYMYSVYVLYVPPFPKSEGRVMMLPPIEMPSKRLELPFVTLNSINKSILNCVQGTVLINKLIVKYQW